MEKDGQISSGDDSLNQTVHLRVHGMMCQRNCGTTVRQALEEIPGCVVATSSFENSHASITVNLEIYGGVTSSSKGDDSFNFDLSNKLQIDGLVNNLKEEATEAIEDVGFEANVIEDGEDIELQSNKNNDSSKEIDATALQIKSAAEIAKESDMDGIQAIVCVQIQGMSCAVCTGRVEKALTSLGQYVKKASVNLPTSRATIEIPKDIFFSDTTEESAKGKNIDERVNAIANMCTEAIEKAGYDCEILEVYNPSEGSNGGMTLAENAAKLEEMRREELETWSRLLITSLIFTIPLIIIHYSSMFRVSSLLEDNQRWKSWKPWISFILATPVQFGVGKRFYVAAYHSFQSARVMGMDFLISLGTTSAYVYSLIVLGISSMGFAADVEHEEIHLKATFETSAMLLTFVTLGKYLEAYAKGKTASSLQTLMELQPIIATSCIIPNDLKTRDEITGKETLSKDFNINSIQKEEVEVKHVKVGEYLLVIPG